MGTRINVIMNHNIDDYRDQSAVLARLETALSAALAVRDYWVTTETSYSRQDVSWSADPVKSEDKDDYYRSYAGPGSLFLDIGPYSAKIRTGGRWRGFLSIPPLHAVHLKAFRSIGQALGATHLAYFSDCDDVWEVLYEGGSYQDAVPILERYFGLPQPSVEEIVSEIAEETDHGVPSVWYSDKLPLRKAIL